jgi:uncharacterized membrane protein
MFYLEVASRIIHVASAIVLVGGSVFMLLVVQPVIGKMDEGQRATLVDAFISRWKRVVHLGVTLFLVSGIYNYYLVIQRGLHKGDGLYHGLLGAKMLMALAVFFIAAALVGRSSALARFRENRRLWTAVVVLLAAIIVCISGYLKIRGVVPPLS